MANGGLVILPYRQQQVRQLMLGELVEDVALILAAVAPPQESVFFCVFIEIHAGIVAGGQIVVPQQQRPLQKSTEF